MDEEPDVMIHGTPPRFAIPWVPARRDPTPRRRSAGRTTTAGAGLIVLVSLLGSAGGAAAASPTASPVPSAAATDPLTSLCTAFDDFVSTWYGYPFAGIDPATVTPEDRRASADTYTGDLAAIAERIDVWTGGLGDDPVAAAGRSWTGSYLETERGLAEAFATSAGTEQYDPAFDAAVTAETAADATLLASIRALSPEVRATTEPVEACLPTFLRGEPVDGWTSPVTWHQLSKDTFGPRTKWPKVDEAEVRTKVAGGEYLMTVKRKGFSHWVSALDARLDQLEDLADVRVSASVTVPDGTVDGGLMCREVDGIGYLFMVSPSDYQIRRMEGATSTKLAERFPTTVGHPVPAGKPVVVTAECTGSGLLDDPITLTLSIDGDEVLQVHDREALLTAGAIGVIVSTTEATSDPTGRFDDLTVSVPEG
jgi:hypothetical protein